jgi:FHS family glucose/mannose:H+ symporter-like MFS transporter
VLEGFKDLPIAAVSFLVASFLPRFGYKKAMLAALAIVACATWRCRCCRAFATAKLLFLCVGVAFALVKVSVYSTIGLIARTQAACRHHEYAGRLLHGRRAERLLDLRLLHRFGRPEVARLAEGVLAAVRLCALTFLLVLSTPLRRARRAAAQPRPMATSPRCCAVHAPLVCVFVLTAFLYVLVEQSVGTWLPTFNNEILKLPAAMSVQVTSIYAACLALGRLSAGVVMRRLNWYPVLNACMLAMGGDGAAGAAAGARHRPRPRTSAGPRAGGDLPVPADRPVHGADLPGHQFGDAVLPAAPPALRR